MILLLQRFAYLPKVTLGLLSLRYSERQFRVFTIERPWLNNEENVSCIPEGIYIFKKDDFHGRYANIRLLGVDPRTDIEFHRANVSEELKGCIAPCLGINLGPNGEAFGTNSKLAMDAIMEEYSNSFTSSPGANLIEIISGEVVIESLDESNSIIGLDEEGPVITA